RQTLLGALGTRLKEASAVEWEGRLRPLGLAVAAVKELADALDGELVRERGMVVSIDTAEGPLRVIASPIRFDGAPTELRPSPRLHEHTAELVPPPAAEPNPAARGSQQ